MPRAPVAAAAAANTGHRFSDGSAMSGTSTARPVRNDSTQGPSPRPNCSSSMRAETASVAQTGSCTSATVIIVIDAPVIGSHSTQARHTARAASEPPTATASARAWLNRA